LSSLALSACASEKFWWNALSRTVETFDSYNATTLAAENAGVNAAP
jgi:hypothetical protein